MTSSAPPLEHGFPADYVPIEKIDSGGFGSVWMATPKSSDELLVLKLPYVRPDRSDLERFKREIQLQSQLDHHNILPILDYDDQASIPWFAAPLADMNLADALPKLSESQALALFSDVLLGVSYAHKNRVLHRDIKPGNVLVFGLDASRPYAKVADFGLGRRFTRSSGFQTKVGVGAGTRGFVAPEQWIDLRNADHRADIYSLGRLLEYIVAEVSAPDSQLAHRLEYCIRTATANDREDRYQSIDDLQTDVRFVLERPKSLERPTDTALAMIQEILEKGEIDTQDVRRLATFLLENRQDFRLMLSILPRMPGVIRSVLVRQHGPAMLPILHGYIGHLENALAVDSVLTAARFLEEILEETNSSDIRILCQRTILTLAQRYDIAELAYVAARCLSSESDWTTLQALSHYLAENPDVAAWCARHLSRLSLPAIMRDQVETSL